MIMTYKDEIKWGERLSGALLIAVIILACVDLEPLFDMLGVGL